MFILFTIYSTNTNHFYIHSIIYYSILFSQHTHTHTHTPNPLYCRIRIDPSQLLTATVLTSSGCHATLSVAPFDPTSIFFTTFVDSTS